MWIDNTNLMLYIIFWSNNKIKILAFHIFLTEIENWKWDTSVTGIGTSELQAILSSLWTFLNLEGPLLWGNLSLFLYPVNSILQSSYIFAYVEWRSKAVLWWQPICRKVPWSPLAGRPCRQRIRVKNRTTSADLLKTATAAAIKRSGIKVQRCTSRDRLTKPFCITHLHWSLNCVAAVTANVDNRWWDLFLGERGLWFGVFRDYRSL